MLNVLAVSTGVCGFFLGVFGVVFVLRVVWISFVVVCFSSVVQNLGKFFLREMVGVWSGFWFGFAGCKYGFFLVILVRCCHSLWFMFRNVFESAGVAVGFAVRSFSIRICCCLSRCSR